MKGKQVALLTDEQLKKLVNRKGGHGGKFSRFPFHTMRIGEYFIAPYIDASTIRPTALRIELMTGKKFNVRQSRKDMSVTVWRIK